MAPDEIIKWLNDNQGVLTLTLFLISLFLGWISGIFDSLRGKPKFKISLIEGPTFCTTFLIGKKHGEHDVHRTAISLYLYIANLGHAPGSIESVIVRYRWGVHPLHPLRFLRRMIWLPAMAVVSDFQVNIGENLKVFPMLLQSGRSADTYLREGEAVNGVCYFEQTNSWGAFHPFYVNGKAKLQVIVRDSRGAAWSKNIWIPVVSLEEAKKFNPSFGDTLAHIHGEMPKTDN